MDLSSFNFGGKSEFFNESVLKKVYDKSERSNMNFKKKIN